MLDPPAPSVQANPYSLWASPGRSARAPALAAYAAALAGVAMSRRARRPHAETMHSSKPKHPARRRVSTLARVLLPCMLIALTSSHATASAPLADIGGGRPDLTPLLLPVGYAVSVGGAVTASAAGGLRFTRGSSPARRWVGAVACASGAAVAGYGAYFVHAGYSRGPGRGVTVDARGALQVGFGALHLLWGGALVAGGVSSLTAGAPPPARESLPVRERAPDGCAALSLLPGPSGATLRLSGRF